MSFFNQNDKYKSHKYDTTSHGVSIGQGRIFGTLETVEMKNKTLDGDNNTFSNIPPTAVSIATLGTPTYTNLEHQINIYNSTMYKGCTIEHCASADCIDISAGTFTIRASDETTAQLISGDIEAEADFSLDAGTNYIYIDYNSGTPQFVKYSSENKTETHVRIGIVYKDASGRISHIQNGDSYNDFQYNVSHALEEIFGLRRACGLVTTEDAVVDRAINCTAGEAYKGMFEYSIGAVDSTVNYDITEYVSTSSFKVSGNHASDFTIGHTLLIDGSTSNDGDYLIASSTYDETDTIVVLTTSTLTVEAVSTSKAYYQPIQSKYTSDSGSTWTTVLSTSLDNENYNNTASGLSALGQYGVFWCFQNTHEEYFCIYGQQNYANLARASLATLPAVLPDEISDFTVSVAKIIFQKSATNFTSIETPYETQFTTSAVTNHNDLGNLQGGSAGEYYHLPQTAYNVLSGSNQEVAQASTPTFGGLYLNGGLYLSGGVNSHIKMNSNTNNACIISDLAANQFVNMSSQDGSEYIRVNEDLNMWNDANIGFYSGTGANKILFPDALEGGLTIGQGATPYLTFESTNGTERSIFNENACFEKDAEVLGELVADDDFTCNGDATFEGINCNGGLSANKIKLDSQTHTKSGSMNTSNYSLQYIENTTAGGVTMTLPEYPSPRQYIEIIDGVGNAGTYTITIVTTGSTKISGQDTVSISSDYGTIQLRAGWLGNSYYVLE